MIICIPHIFPEKQLKEINAILSKAKFVDGKITAGWHSKLVKDNQQLNWTDDMARELEEKAIAALKGNLLFKTAVRPKAIHTILFSRYNVGMHYGRHVDNALMETTGIDWRADVSFTIFLTPPEAYEGGELVIETVQEEKAYKLEAGSAIVYPSNTLHRVEPVTKGARLAIVGWVQSYIRDPSDREIIFELDTVRHKIFNQGGKNTEFDLLSKNIANLVRKWADA
jgi:PKHD-type hydroxylase